MKTKLISCRLLSLVLGLTGCTGMLGAGGGLLSQGGNSLFSGEGGSFWEGEDPLYWDEEHGEEPHGHGQDHGEEQEHASQYDHGEEQEDAPQYDPWEEQEDYAEQAQEPAEEQADGDAQENGSGSSSSDQGSASDQAQEPDPDAYPAPDFSLTDQFGNTHRLSDYRGKVVFLNFWATWCSPCRAEMPDIQKLYEEFRTDGRDDVVILGVAYPGNFSEESVSGVSSFLEENGYTYPVVMDTSAQTSVDYYIQAFPTTYMIDKNGNIFGYMEGMLEESDMREMINSTLNGR